MKIYESSQDYLETILILSKKLDHVRNIDIAVEMNVTKQSVHRALRKLKDLGYISIDDHGHITLTELGIKEANQMYERHLILTKYFISLGVPEDIATKDACKIEHDLSEETFNAIKKIMEK